MSSITHTAVINKDLNQVVKLPIAVMSSLKEGIMTYSPIADMSVISDADYQALAAILTLPAIDKMDTQDFVISRMKANDSWDCDVESDDAWAVMYDRLDSSSLLHFLESIDAQVAGWKELTVKQIIEELDLDISHLSNDNQAFLVDHLIFGSDFANIDQIENDDGKHYLILGSLSEVSLDELDSLIAEHE